MREGTVISEKVVRVGLVEKVAFQQRRQGGRKPRLIPGVTVVQSGGTSSAKTLRQDHAGSAGRPLWLEWSGHRGFGEDHDTSLDCGNQVRTSGGRCLVV